MRWLVVASLVVSAVSAAALDLPLGDGHVSDRPTSRDTCTRARRRFAAAAPATWPLVPRRPWNPAEKPHVTGKVLWPDAAFSLDARGDRVTVEGNGLPGASSRPAAFRSRPAIPRSGSHEPQSHRGRSNCRSHPGQAVRGRVRRCLPMGMIGSPRPAWRSTTRSTMRGATRRRTRSRICCDGHPQARGQYHYHSGSPCIPGADGIDRGGVGPRRLPVPGDARRAGAARHRRGPRRVPRARRSRHRGRPPVHVRLPPHTGLSLHARLFHRRGAGGDASGDPARHGTAEAWRARPWGTRAARALVRAQRTA